MTYLLLSAPFVVAALVLFGIGAAHAGYRRDLRRYLSAWGASTAVLLVLTAVFDNIMIAAGFFDYREGGISGVRIVLMPVEDLLYPIAGALLLSGVWQLLDAAREPGGRSDA
ncbi:lycopene cyclase domain-containing protein [Microbacterium sp. 22195]|uniref:lycopene cyclase domain-containing protein n=1 Tax=Microbacterium sp. 22195 TaxID=3453891 RepID=UPI003F868D10